MPFISRHHIDPEVRARYDNQHRTKLKEALLSPHLTDEQRQKIRQQLRPAESLPVIETEVLTAASQEKSLTQDSVAISKSPSREELTQLKKKELVALAEQLGLPTTGDRAQLIIRIRERS